MVWLPSTNTGVAPPQAVADSEQVARSVHQRSGFKRGKQVGEDDKVTFRAFDPPKDPDDRNKRLREISVDRCRYLTEDQAVELAWERAPARGGEFFGWAVISAEEVRKCKPQVVSSPAVDQDNTAHADIMLPPGDIDDAQVRNRRLTELAAASCWKDGPSD
jgi:hypothetical protein